MRARYDGAAQAREAIKNTKAVSGEPGSSLFPISLLEEAFARSQKISCDRDETSLPLDTPAPFEGSLSAFPSFLRATS